LNRDTFLRIHHTRAPQEWEKQAAAKRRALEILEIQREEDEWCAPRAAPGPVAKRTERAWPPRGGFR
jgi:hypothetical protein